jgi:putative membrane-bound dehydrogenase-like protein
MKIVNENRFLLSILMCCLTLFSCAEKKHYTDALPPEEEMKHFVLDSAFKIELFAAEPYVQSPVDMTWDDEGNVYVIEMGDYPWKPVEGQGKGRIRILRDMNGDGKIDSAIVFADKIADATSMLPWKGGLIVTAAPDILYLKDTSGDFHADTKEVLFTGFFANNSEAQITCLRFGVDNWIYANNNAQDGDVSFVKNISAPKLPVGGSDFRFRMDKDLFEKESGWGQFGATLDDWGHRFYSQNTYHIQQSPIQWRYLSRHKFMPPGSSDVNISDHDFLMYQQTPPPYWRAERTKRRQEEFDKQKLDRKEYADKHFTGASGGTIYLSDVFPEEYYGSVFTGEVAGNLVHRDLLVREKENPAYVAKRSVKEKESEFLTSTDPWTRPANFAVGADGCLYMIDMYRQHIEAPTSVPDDLKKEMDYSNGEKYGRIYKISPKNYSAERSNAINLNSKSSEELVALIADANEWKRTRAHMLLVQRQDKSVIPLLKVMFQAHNDARARLRALYVLEAFDALDAAMVSKALKDPEPGVREHAIILSERYSHLLPQVINMVNDSSAQVALQATLSIGNSKDAKVIPAFANVIQYRAAQPLFRTAVLSSDAGSGATMLKELASNESLMKDTSVAKFIHDLCYVVGARNDHKEVADVTTMIRSAHLDAACLESLEKGRKKSRDAASNK